MKAIARAKAANSDQPASFFLSQDLQRLCIAVRRANARAVLTRGCDLSGLSDQAVSDAAAIIIE